MYLMKEILIFVKISDGDGDGPALLLLLYLLDSMEACANTMDLTISAVCWREDIRLLNSIHGHDE
jgi:hypothetical protein